MPGGEKKQKIKLSFSKKDAIKVTFLLTWVILKHLQLMRVCCRSLFVLTPQAGSFKPSV